MRILQKWMFKAVLQTISPLRGGAAATSFVPLLSRFAKRIGSKDFAMHHRRCRSLHSMKINCCMKLINALSSISISCALMGCQSLSGGIPGLSGYLQFVRNEQVLYQYAVPVDGMPCSQNAKKNPGRGKRPGGYDHRYFLVAIRSDS